MVLVDCVAPNVEGVINERGDASSGNGVAIIGASRVGISVGWRFAGTDGIGDRVRRPERVMADTSVKGACEIEGAGRERIGEQT